MLLQVASFGVGNHVKLPGPTQKEPNVYKFGTPYEDIFNDLKSKNSDLYIKNGLLPMLRRNMTVKRAPEKWQDNRFAIRCSQSKHINTYFIEVITIATSKTKLAACCITPFHHHGLVVSTTTSSIKSAVYCQQLPQQAQLRHSCSTMPQSKVRCRGSPTPCAAWHASVNGMKYMAGSSN